MLLEYAENETLRSYITKKEGEENFQKYFRQLCEAVDYLHKHDVMHGDLKPENILLDRDFNIKLADFGCASKDIKSFK